MMSFIDVNIFIYSYRFIDLKKRVWRDGVNQEVNDNDVIYLSFVMVLVFFCR